MQYSLTIFTSIFDNKTHRKVVLNTWDEFEKLLYSLSKKPGYKPTKDERFHPNASRLISPAIFSPGDTRKNINVKCWGGWAALDVDEYPNGFDAALRVFKDYRFICYSSASSTKEHPKFRVVLPLSREVTSEEIRHFWFSLNTEFKSLGDAQTKDFSRMYYVPAQYPNAFNFIISNRKSPIIDVDVLLKKYEYAKELYGKTFGNQLSDEIQKQVNEFRRTQLNNTNYKWSSLSDCPFVNQQIVREYGSISNTGWYRTMFKFLLSIASSAMRKGYPITAYEIATLGRELDSRNGGWYKNRPLETEADRAIAYACKSL